MEPCFAVTAPGLEKLAAEELRLLNLTPLAAGEPGGTGGSVGGVRFDGELEDVYRTNLHLRTASRVLVRLGEFHAAAFSELRKKAARLSWERYLRPGSPIQLSVTCHKSRLYHSGAVAERVVGAIEDRLGCPSPVEKPDKDEGAPAAQLVLARLVNDWCSVSIDSSGELLHRRGYRLATARAPLRETLAAAMLLASGWDLSAPLLDPFCGSGTIAIEAALLTLGLPPGRKRRFAFMDWPGYDPGRWETVLAAGMPSLGRRAAIIQASDRDAGAIRMAQDNARRAGVLEAIEFSQRAVSAVEPPPGPGWVVTNPPYGVRVSQNKDLRNLYAQFGHVLRRACPGWQVALLGNDPNLAAGLSAALTGLHLKAAFTSLNGGISVRLMLGRVPAEAA